MTKVWVDLDHTDWHGHLAERLWDDPVPEIGPLASTDELAVKLANMFELIVTHWMGWDGLPMASPQSGVRLVRSCDGCRHMVFAISEPSRLIDPDAWDGSDLFIVWPLPLFRFASERLANLLREERISGVKLIAASDIPLKKGNTATPGRLSNWMSADRARKLGRPLGIE